MPRPTRVRLAPETLEARENPAGGTIQSFDLATPPALPASWSEWSSDGSNAFDTAAAKGVGGSVGVTSNGGSRTAALAWSGETVTGDTGAAVSVNLSSLVPTFVFARGTNLGTASPSYVAATVTRGATVAVQETSGGSTRTLASVTSTAYFSGNWARVTLIPTGDAVAVQVMRQDTGQYLNAQGKWQAATATAISVKTTIPVAEGAVGIGRGAVYAGAVAIDNFEVIPPPPPAPPPAAGVTQAFDTTTAGTRPTGWAGWSSDAASGFAAGTTRALSPTNGFASAGGSTSSSRAWADAVLPADVDASAAIYLDSLVPARLFVRGSNLDTTQPTYYAVSVTRGLETRLVKVVGGVETTLATLKSSAYTSSLWVRARLTAVGDQLRGMLYRPDTRQWLSPDGTWSDSPDYAFDLRDSGIAGGGKAGVARASQYAGTITFDDFSAQPASVATGPVIAISASSSGTVTGETTFRATVAGAVSRIEFRLGGVLRAASATTPAEWTFDSTTVVNGAYTLTVRAFDGSGNFGSADYAFTVSNLNMDPVPKPAIPRHYSHIRIAELAYGGNPMGAFEQQLLRNSVDLVIPNTQYLSTINSVSPNTPQLIYSNVSNLYQGLLTDWLSYADRTGASREAAFYHVTHATPFVGASPSSQPVTWFWGGYQSAPNGTLTDVTSAIRGGRSFNVGFGGAGQWTSIGHLDRFREMNVSLVSAAAAGWSGAWEYVSAVYANGQPTAWKALNLNQDGTRGLTSSGTIAFDPPADWRAATIGGNAPEFFVRLRATAGSEAQAPVLKTVFGRDYVRANGTSGVIPAFDYAADKDHDGYLNDTEYATRNAGMDARFIYESRLFYPYYGQMRFVTNPSASAVRKWAADYHVRLLNASPLADGIFMDNAIGKLPFPGISVLEPTGTYSSDSGALIAAVNRAIAPRWVMSNTAGGTSEGDAIAAGSGAVFEEFMLRPLTASWAEVGDATNLVAQRLNASGSPYVVIDSLPNGGSPTDPRTQLATLAYYYLVADPDRTMLMFFGGANPSTPWMQHWSQAATVNVGRPTEPMRLFASGADPISPSLTYKVFARNYENALMLYKPLSYTQGAGEGTLSDGTATMHQLGGNYRRVNADGSLGGIITAISLRNGEGAVLMKA